VRDPFSVRFIERVGNVDGVPEHLFHWQRPLGQARGQCCSLQVLHHEEVDAVLMADVAEDRDMRMIQAGDGTRFALEPLAQVRLVGEMRGQHFDCDGAVEPPVDGSVDLSLPPAPTEAWTSYGPRRVPERIAMGSNRQV
jgi:hypothetical protein